MESKSRIVRYSLGKITISADLNSFLSNPARLLQRHRSFKGSMQWSPGDSFGLSNNEEDADRIIEYSKGLFSENYVDSGIKPLKSIHGLAFYEKYLIMRFDQKKEDIFYRQLSKYLDIELKQFEDWVIRKRKEKIRGFFWE